MDTLNLLLDGFQSALTLENLGYACIGVLLGTVVGVLPGPACHAGDGVAMDANESAGLAHPVAFGEMVEDGTGLVLEEVGV